LENVAFHCQVTGHYTVSCAKTAKPIQNPDAVMDEDSGGPKDPQGKGQLWRVVRAIQKHWQYLLQRRIANNVM